jgi:NADH dehydrogenase FAD-containing subunit
MRAMLTPPNTDHTIGSPLALADEAYGEKAWRKYEDVKAIQHPSIRVVQGSVSKLNCESKTAMITHSTGHTSIVEYDYAICCSGLRREHPSVPQSLFREKYLEECQSHISDIRSVKESIVIIGGGLSPWFRLI